jgi:membrane protein DedA with SNARE-associated domain
VLFVGWLLLADYEREIGILRDVWSASLSPDTIGPYLSDIFRERILIVACFVCLFGGEPAVLFFAFLSAQGKLDPSDVAIIGFTTALIGELFWFVFAKTHVFNFLDSKFFEIGKGSRLFAQVKRVLDAAPFKMFFLARFISGITIPCIIYLGRKRLELKTFFLYCLAINFFWAPTITLIGWSSGKGFTLVLETFKSIQIALNIAFACLIVGYLVYRYVVRHIIRTSSEIELPD